LLLLSILQIYFDFLCIKSEFKHICRPCAREHRQF